MEELDGIFAITRNYGSTTPISGENSAMAGILWLGKRSWFWRDGTIIYVRPDGKGLICERQEDGSYLAPEGYDYVLEPLDTLEMERAYTATSIGDVGGRRDRRRIQMPQNRALGMRTTVWRQIRSFPEVRQCRRQKAGRSLSQMGLRSSLTPMACWVEAANAKGHTTSYLYDDAWTLTEIITPSGKSFGVEQDEERKDPGDHSSGRAGVLTYEYDDQENLIQVTNPEGGVRRYEYDDAHHMTAWYDEDGNQVVANTYDEQGRVTEQARRPGKYHDFLLWGGCHHGYRQPGKCHRLYPG